MCALIVPLRLLYTDCAVFNSFVPARYSGSHLSWPSAPDSVYLTEKRYSIFQLGRRQAEGAVSGIGAWGKSGAGGAIGTDLIRQRQG
jgi:hypothetical protein